MYFNIKSYLKSNHNHTTKHTAQHAQETLALSKLKSPIETFHSMKKKKKSRKEVRVLIAHVIHHLFFNTVPLEHPCRLS